MTKRFPLTPAVHFLRKHGLAFDSYLYTYTGLGNVAKDAAAAIGISESELFKTLVFVAGADPLLVLVAAKDRASPRAVSRAIVGHPNVSECSVMDAERYSGYKVGAISPFGTRRQLPVYLDSEALNFERIYVSGGSHGFLVSVPVNGLLSVLNAVTGEFRTG